MCYVVSKMYLNRDNDTFILILQTMAFHILELRKVKFFVPVEALNRSLFRVSYEWMSLFLEKSWCIDFGTSS